MVGSAHHKMAIEDLAVMTQQGFVALHDEISSVKQDTILLKADNLLMSNGIKDVKKEVEEMKNNTGELFKKLDDFISSMKKNEQENAVLAFQVRRLDDRVTKLEGKKK